MSSDVDAVSVLMEILPGLVRAGAGVCSIPPADYGPVKVAGQTG